MTPLEKQLAATLEHAIDYIQRLYREGRSPSIGGVPSEFTDMLAAYKRYECAQGYDAHTDGQTIWVNAKAGYCIARFGRFGYEIFSPMDDAYPTEGSMLASSAGALNRASWEDFKTALKSFYGITLYDHLYTNTDPDPV